MSTRIYTRTGDAGDTGLFGGERVRKDDLRVEAYGTVDELNAALGLARLQPPDAELDSVLADLQSELFVLGSDLATPGANDSGAGSVTIQRIDSAAVARLEALIDQYEAELPPLTNFILPGGHALAAQLHWCRVVCRRAERRCVTLLNACAPPGAEEEHVPQGQQEDAVNPRVVPYLNRLSDLLFVLARVANHRQSIADVVWRRPQR